MTRRPGKRGRGRGNVVADLDGVVYLDDQRIPGAGTALTELDALGYRILFVTNNSTRTVHHVARRVAELTGYSARPDQVLSSALATGRMLRGHLETVFVVGEAGLTETLESEGISVTPDWQEAEAVVVGLDRKLTYVKLRDATRALYNGARFVATNLDPTYPTPEGFWPGGGSIAAALAASSGVEPEVAGKPYPPMRELVRAALGPGPTWIVGDRADTDLEMGRLEKWTRVLVLSGVTRSIEELSRSERPELVLDSVALLPAALEND